MSNETPDRKAKNATSEDVDGGGTNESAVGSMFTGVGPSAGTVVSYLLGTLLFGGLLLLFGGAALFALQYGTEVALVVLGVALLVLAFVIAQIAARAGLI